MEENNLESEKIPAKDTCEVFVFDENKVKKLKKFISQTEDLAPLFKVLADSTRLKIAYILSLEKELCVCDIATIIESSNATASHHLRLLNNMGLAKYRKEGKMAFYSLQSPHLRHLIQEAIRLKKGSSDYEHCSRENTKRC